MNLDGANSDSQVFVNSSDGDTKLDGKNLDSMVQIYRNWYEPICVDWNGMKFAKFCTHLNHTNLYKFRQYEFEQN